MNYLTMYFPWFLLIVQLKKKQKEVEEITQQLENFEDPETTRQRITKLNEEISQLRDEVMIDRERILFRNLIIPRNYLLFRINEEH